MNDPRILFSIFGRDIHWYGVMFALGFFLAVVHWGLLGKKTQRHSGLGSDCGLWLMIGGIIGARLMYVIQFWRDFVDAPLNIIRIDQGGLVFYGGFIGGVVAIIIYANLKKPSTWTLGGTTYKESVYSLGDFLTTALPLGHAMGRIGCYLHGCCYGKECQPAWYSVHKLIEGPAGVTRDGPFLFPSQLTEAGGQLVIFGILLWFYFRNKVDGRVFALNMVLYGILRFFNEFIRGDKDDYTVLGITDAQWISVGLFVGGIIVWTVFSKRNKRQLA